MGSVAGSVAGITDDTQQQPPRNLPRLQALRRVLPQPLATPLALSHSLTRRVAFEALERVINGRLFATLREELGLVYQVNVRFSDGCFSDGCFSDDGGRYTISLAAAPEHVEQASEAALAVVEGLARQTRPVTRREVAYAQRGLLSASEARRRDPEWCAAVLAGGGTGSGDHAAWEVAGPAFARAVRRLTRDAVRETASGLSAGGSNVKVVIASTR